MFDHRALRSAIASISHDVSTDAIGQYAPTLDQIFAPEAHAVALDPATPIVVGARGAGKSFWSGVLGNPETRLAAAKAYPQLGLQHTTVGFGFTGLEGPEGVGAEALDAGVPPDADLARAKAFWWATVLRAAAGEAGGPMSPPHRYLEVATDWESRQAHLAALDQTLLAADRTLLIVYDALDTVAHSWPRTRLLTQALLEVIWATRAYRRIKLKAFLRPDQLEDEALQFVELPKLRTGAVRLQWSKSDLYGLLFARLALTPKPTERAAFEALLGLLHLPTADQDAILARHWALSHDASDQARAVAQLAGPFMGEGQYAYKKGKTYDWIFAHLGDAYAEVTPRSFLGLWIAAAKYGEPPVDKALGPDGIRHGLRSASKTRVDQLAHEFPWIKGVLTPLAGLLLPQPRERIFEFWREADTVNQVLADAKLRRYLPPFPAEGPPREEDLFTALERIGVMNSRNDGRLDMPDLFRVAARLLKKGATAPV